MNAPQLFLYLATFLYLQKVFDLATVIILMIGWKGELGKQKNAQEWHGFVDSDHYNNENMRILFERTAF
ncbi:hypothetical protein UR09_00995 [Candidatus Nitromaritima sp. SCGC AAA799-A02]|nr:hypothetical protein UR09_00995 [Candidatus Nitromaritima sp. SCGC AAA799-A02]